MSGQGSHSVRAGQSQLVSKQGSYSVWAGQSQYQSRAVTAIYRQSLASLLDAPCFFPLYWLPKTRDQKWLNFYWFTWSNVVNKLFLMKRNASPCMTFNQMRCPRVHYRCDHERVKTCFVCLGLICNLIFFSVLDVIRLWFKTLNCTFLNY